MGTALLALLAMGTSVAAQAGQRPLPAPVGAGVRVDDALPSNGSAPACGGMADVPAPASLRDAGPGFDPADSVPPCPGTVLLTASESAPDPLPPPKKKVADADAPAAAGGDPVEPGLKSQPGAASGDINRDIYYKNRLDFSLEGGWLPVNIPFVFDFLLGSGYNMTPLKYTLMPILLSLRWQFDDVGGPWIFRGNWDFTATAGFTPIPRGPETRYLSYIMGIRRNFVHPRWRVAPYWEGRVGVGNIDAKEPMGVPFAQGQDLTFTLMLGSGVRYNLSPRYAIEGGMSYMHISNMYLSEPRYLNYGINVYGPMVGLDVRLGKGRKNSETR